MLDRREMMRRAGMAALATGFGSLPALALDSVTLPFDNGERPLVKYPQKRLMIGLTSRRRRWRRRSPSSTTARLRRTTLLRPLSSGRHPLDIDPDKFSLQVKGKVDRPLTLSLKDIRKLGAVELVAVNQCSGNSRGFFERGWRAANWAMARWAMPAGTAYR